ncbi:hypothetical protein [Legionella birminghamensis]|nr:hypothetical protein [Legionella birminghamensis]
MNIIEPRQTLMNEIIEGFSEENNGSNLDYQGASHFNTSCIDAVICC